MKKIALLFFAAMLLFSACGRTPPQESPSPSPVSTPAPSPSYAPSPEPSPEPSPVFPAFSLTILHTNDWHGILDDVPRYSTLIREIRDETENVLLLDGGDIFRRGPFQDYLGEVETVIMNAMGYDALVFGNNDFPRRARELEDISQHPILLFAEFPVLCANVTVDGAPLPGMKPYVIIHVGGLDIAVVGVTSMKPHNRNEFASEWADFSEPETAVAEQLEQVRGISDIQIVLSHAGIEKDRLMRGVSAIIGGDDHLKLDRPVSSRDGEMQIPIVQAGGEENHYLGRLDLEFAEINGVWVLREFYGRLLSVGGVAPDAAIVRIIEDYWAKVLVPVA